MWPAWTRLARRNPKMGKVVHFHSTKLGRTLNRELLEPLGLGGPIALEKGESEWVWDEVGRSRRPVSLNQRGGGAFEARTWSAEWAAGQRRRRRGAVN